MCCCDYTLDSGVGEVIAAARRAGESFRENDMP